MRTVVISITDDGDRLTRKLLYMEGLGCVPYFSVKSKEMKLGNIIEKEFDECDAIVFITSLGICVRVSAPFLKSKKTDPAVICIPNDGSFVISVTGGHLGGANELTSRLAKTIGAVPVITTATDSKGIKAPDMIAKDRGLSISSMDDCRKIASLLVNGKKVAVHDESGTVNLRGYHTYMDGEAYDGIVVIGSGSQKHYDAPVQLYLIKRNTILGIGCRKDHDPEDMIKKTEQVLEEMDISPLSVAAVATIELKAKEPAVKALADHFGSELKIFSNDEIKMVEHQFECSDFVMRTIGVGCVAEPCVALADGKIIRSKQKLDGMTLAVGKTEEKQ